MRLLPQILTVETVETVKILREAITMAMDQVSLRLTEASVTHGQELRMGTDSALQVEIRKTSPSPQAASLSPLIRNVYGKELRMPESSSPW